MKILGFLLLTALFIGLFMVTILFVVPPDSVIVPMGKIAISGMCLCTLIGCVVWVIHFGKTLNAVAIQTWVVSLTSIIAMMLIIWFSVQNEESHQWLGGYVPFLFIFFIVLVVSLFSTGQTWKGSLVRQVWNPSKGLAGMAFGDFANSIGILAGVGAFQLVNVSEGWFWLGQFGASLAMLISLNLCLRWMREKVTKDWFYILLPYLCSAFTFLALISASASLNRSGELQGALKISQTVFFGVMLLFVSIMFAKNYRTGRHFVFLLVGIIVVTGVQIAGIWLIPSNGTDISWASNLFGVLATGTGVILELFTFYEIWHPFWTGEGYKKGEVLSTGVQTYYIGKWKDPIKLIRGLDIILGNIALLIMIFWVTADQTNFTEGQWFLFSGAIVLMIQASLGGIVISANEVAERRAREREEQAAQRRRRLSY